MAHRQLPGPETVATQEPPRRRALLDLVATEVGHVVEVRNVSVLGLRALGLFGPMMRGLAEISYEFEQSFVLDTSKYEATFDTLGIPLVAAVAETVAWYRNQAGNK